MRKKIIIEQEDTEDDLDSVYGQLKYLQRLKGEGQDIPNHFYPNWFDDELLYDVKKTQTHDWDIEIRFNDLDDMWNIFCDMQDYDRYTLNSLFSSYSSSLDYISSDTMYEDIKEGYYPDVFETTESQQYIKDIIYFEAPELLPCLNNDENEKYGRKDICKTLIFNLLMKEYNSEFDDIIDNYTYEINSTVYNSLKDMVTRDYCDLELIGLETISCFYRYKISLDLLIEKFEEYNQTNNSVHELLKVMSCSENLDGPYDIEEDVYSHVDNQKAVQESQSYTSGRLEKILQKIEDDNEDIETYKETMQWVMSKYPFGVTVPTKWSDEVLITVLGVDKETNKITVNVNDTRSSNVKRKVANLTKDELNVLYHQPKLF
jgi:hypothetical protein